jgi:hypothetical protein
MMVTRNSTAAKWALGVMVCLVSLLAGCAVGWWGYSQHWNAVDAALGEEHEVSFSAHDTLLMTQDALRGDGILFEVGPNDTLSTLWRNADLKVGFFESLMGVQPRYRYEIQVIPEGSHKSKIVVNLHTEAIPDDQLDRYKASKRFALFREIDEIAAKYPPPSGLPSSGGVNFTLLPQEDLRSFAKRVTGDANNWRQIAKDNGLRSPTDVTPFQSVWVSNSLLKKTSNGGSP